MQHRRLVEVNDAKAKARTGERRSLTADPESIAGN
jgi:hypothetical protein